MEEFDKMWKEQNPSPPDPPTQSNEPKHEDTDEYMHKEGVARVNMLIDFLDHYFFAKHGYPRDPLFQPECDDIDFMLK
jgi:hypothetical protein